MNRVFQCNIFDSLTLGPGEKSFLYFFVLVLFLFLNGVECVGGLAWEGRGCTRFKEQALVRQNCIA